MSQSKPAYKRILLKLSGEALMGDDAFGINHATIVRMVDEVAEVTRLGVEVADRVRSVLHLDGRESKRSRDVVPAVVDQ